MSKVFRNKKIFIVIIIVVLAAVVMTVVLSNGSLSDGSESDSSENDGSSMSVPPTEIENVKHVYIDLPEGWEEQMATEAREFAESIKGNVVAEIDSQSQPPGISPETTISVDKGGYDIVIKGAMIFGSTAVNVYNESGKTVSTKEHFLLDDEFRTINVSKGNYRIVVERQNVEGVNVDCLLKIFLELTPPEIELPSLIAKSQIRVKNPYGTDMDFESNGIKTTIAAKKSSVINLAEGINDIVYYLKDGNNVSPEITYKINCDTTPPVITLRESKEKYEDGNGRAIFNMRINEYPAYIKINGKGIEVGGGLNSDGTYSCGHVEDISVRSIVVEAADLAGNVTKTKITR